MYKQKNVFDKPEWMTDGIKSKGDVAKMGGFIILVGCVFFIFIITIPIGIIFLITGAIFVLVSPFLNNEKLLSSWAKKQKKKLEKEERQQQAIKNA